MDHDKFDRAVHQLHLADLRHTGRAVLAAHVVLENPQRADGAEVLEGFDSNSEFQGELLRVMDELKSALQNVDAFAEQLKERPNSLLFAPKTGPDREPRVEP